MIRARIRGLDDDQIRALVTQLIRRRESIDLLPAESEQAAVEELPKVARVVRTRSRKPKPQVVSGVTPQAEG